MTASLPPDIQQVFDRFVTTEYTTVAPAGEPITWPVTPYYRAGDPCIDVTMEPGYPRKVDEARSNPRVALLFSDPTGSGTAGAPQVLVQGTADVDDLDSDADRERVHVRPERIYVWPGGDVSREPQLFDAHMEEVRSGHDEEPDAELAPATGAPPAWDARLDELGERCPEAVVSLVAPDGFPFSVRLPIGVDSGARRIRIGGAPLGVPWQPGLACLTAHDHAPDFAWQRVVQVCGDLVEEGGAWAIVPHASADADFPQRAG